MQRLVIRTRIEVVLAAADKCAIYVCRETDPPWNYHQNSPICLIGPRGRTGFSKTTSTILDSRHLAGINNILFFAPCLPCCCNVASDGRFNLILLLLFVVKLCYRLLGKLFQNNVYIRIYILLYCYRYLTGATTVRRQLAGYSHKCSASLAGCNHRYNVLFRYLLYTN